MEVKVYTLPNCVQCDSSKKFLAKHHVDYQEISLADDREAYDYVRSLGYSQAPVIVAGGSHWSGFRMGQLQNLLKRIHGGESKDQK